jgi:hypothetical protein
MGNTVKVKLIRTHVIGRPGEVVVAFGHKCVIQPDGSAVCDMHKDFIPTEVAARRFEVIEPGPAKTKEVVPELAGFTMDVKDCFGTGSIDDLVKELSRLRQDLLQEFAETRFSILIPDTVPLQDAIDQITNLTKRAQAKLAPKPKEPNDASEQRQEPGAEEKSQQKAAKKTSKK